VVKIGVSYSSDEQAGIAAIGHAGSAAAFSNYAANIQRDYQLAVSDLNSRGGIDGCKVELVYHDFSALASDGFDGESQKECTDFAEDQHVFAAFTNALETRVLLTCMAQHHTPVFMDNSFEFVPTSADFTTYRGYLYEPDAVALDRLGPVIDDLNAAGYFGAGPKVGILLADDGTGDRQRLVNSIWKPRLAALGIPVASVFTFPQATGYAQLSDTSAQFDSAVLQFKAAGVNRVMITPDGGDSVIFFTQEAQSQNYHPLYGLTTYNAPSTLAWGPSAEAKGAMAVVWQATDVTNNVDDPSGAAYVEAANPPNSARSRCDHIYAAASTTGIEGYEFYKWCDALNLMATALAHSAAVTPQALVSGVDALGGAFQAAATNGPSSFGPARYDGDVDVRVVKWSPAAGELRYVTAPEAIP